jgi:uncharacterized RDD family membrane protein YckC
MFPAGGRKSDMENDNFQFNPEAVGGPAPSESEEPQGPEAAGFNERFLAYVIDALPFVAGAYGTLAVMVRQGGLQYSVSVENIWKVLWILAYIIYETAFSSGGRATLGKFLLGLRVRSADGSELAFHKAFIRSISYFASSAPLCLGYLAALFTPDNRALHDYLGGSRVISVKERGDLANGLILAVSWALMAMLSVSWINQHFLKLSPEEERQVSAAQVTITKIAKLEEIHKMMRGGYTDDIKRLAALTGNPVAVRNEIIRNILPDTLVISTDGRAYIISAKAKNWHETEIQIKSMPAPK